MAVIGLFLFLGCAQKVEDSKGPKEVLDAYLNAVIGGRIEEAYQNLSSADRTGKTLQVFVSEKSDEENFIRGALAKRITYTIKDMTVEGDRAKALVDITAPDFDVIFRDIFSSVSTRELPKGNLEAHAYVSGLLGRTVKRYRDKGIPMRTDVERFHLMKEAGAWKVALQVGKER